MKKRFYIFETVIAIVLFGIGMFFIIIGILLMSKIVPEVLYAPILAMLCLIGAFVIVLSGILSIVEAYNSVRVIH